MLNDKTGMQTPVGSGNYRKYNPVSSTKKNYEGKKKGEKRRFMGISRFSRETESIV